MPGGKGNIKPSDNPKPWKKGQSGNPFGRPPSLESIIDELFSSGGDIKDVLAEGMKKAKKGDLAWAKELLDRIYGKVKQDVAISGGIELHFDKQDEKL